MKIGEINMSLINEDIIEELSIWAKKNEDKNVFPQILEKEDSYYMNRESEETYIMEYSFNTLQELKNSLIKYSGLSEYADILKIMTVAICQEKFRGMNEIPYNIELEEKEDDKKSELPEFVYVF
jgi:hypothetical protein